MVYDEKKYREDSGRPEFGWRDAVAIALAVIVLLVAIWLAIG